MKKLLVILTLALALCLVCGAAMADGLPSVYAGLYDDIWDVEGKTINDVEPGVTVTVAVASDWPDTVWDQLDAYRDDAASHEKIKSFTLPGKDSNGKDRLVEVRVRIGHVYYTAGSIKVDLPDCTKGGTETDTCDVCGKVITYTLEPQDHIWEVKKVVEEATCAKEGSYADVCKRCGVERDGSRKEYGAIPKTAHPTDKQKNILDQAMNCQTDYTATTYHTVCGVCGEIVAEDIHDSKVDSIANFKANAEATFGIKLPADWDGHDFDKWVDLDPATCVKNATQKRWCKICNATFVEEKPNTQKVVELIEGDDTCWDAKENGSITLVCKWCMGVEADGTGIDKDGNACNHSEVIAMADDPVETVEFGEGWTDTYIPSMSGTAADGTVYRVYHDFRNDYLVNPDRVVCKYALYAGGGCKRCSENGYTEVEPVQDHNWSDWELVEDKDETKTETSRWESYCQNEGCTELRVRALAEKPVDPCKEHEWGIKNPAAVKCGENKDVEFECVVCKATKTEDYTKEHAFTVEVSTTDATCVKAGVKVLKCANCDALKTEEIAATSKHTLEKVDGKAATCKEAGLKEAYKCTVCEKLFSDEEGKTEITAQEVIPATSKHTLEKVDGKAATCKEAGLKEAYKCTVCEKLFSDEEGKTEITAQEEIPATEHAFTVEVSTTDATCVKAGVKVLKCANCDALKTEEIAATGKHSLEKVDGKAATCKEAGLKEAYKCTVCEKLFSDEEGKTEITAQEVIPADETAHVWEEEVLKAATCKEAGVALKTCSVCGKVEKVEVAKLAHTPGEPEITAATTEKEGSKVVKCTVCGEVLSTEVLPKELGETEFTAEVEFGDMTLTGKAEQKEGTKEAKAVYARVTYFMADGTYVVVSVPVEADGTFESMNSGNVIHVSVQIVDSAKVRPGEFNRFGGAEFDVK